MGFEHAEMGFGHVELRFGHAEMRFGDVKILFHSHARISNDFCEFVSIAPYIINKM